MAEKIVQRLDKISNSEVTLGLKNGVVLNAVAPNILGVNMIRIPTAPATGTDVTNKTYVDSKLTGMLLASAFKVAPSDDGIVDIGASWDAGTTTLTITGAHKTFGALSGTSTGALTSGQSVITGVVRDNYGHITGYNTATISFTNYQPWVLKGDTATTVSVTSGKTIAIVGDSKIGTEANATADGTNGGIKLVHKAVSPTTASANATITPGTGSIVIHEYEFDSTGHIANITTNTVTITAPAVSVTGGENAAGQYVSGITSTAHGISVTKTAAATSITGAANTDARIPTAGAVIGYVETKLSETDAMKYMGTVNAEADLPEDALVGHTYKSANTTPWVLTAANSATGVNVTVHVGDMLIKNSDGKWDLIPSGNDGNVSSDAAITNGNIVVGAGGQKVKDSGIVLPASPKFTDTITTVAGNADITVGGSAPTYTLSLSATGVGAGTYGANAASGTLSITVPYVTVSAAGRITAAGNVTHDFSSAVANLVNASKLTSTDFSIVGTTIGIGTDANFKLYKSTDGNTLTWGGTDLKLGASSVATKVGAGKTGQIFVADGTGGLNASGVSIQTSAGSWTGNDTTIPTAGAVEERVQELLMQSVPDGVAQVVKVSMAAVGTASSSASIPAGALIKKVVVDVKTAYAGATGATIAVGTDVVAIDGEDYALDETAKYIVEPYVTTADGGKVNITNAESGNPTAGAADVFVEYIAAPIA